MAYKITMQQANTVYIYLYMHLSQFSTTLAQWLSLKQCTRSSIPHHAHSARHTIMCSACEHTCDVYVYVCA